MALGVTNPPASAEDVKQHGFDPWVRKIPWRRKWQYSCLENPIDGGAWGATVHGVAESDTFELLSTQAQFSTAIFLLPFWLLFHSPLKN